MKDSPKPIDQKKWKAPEFSEEEKTPKVKELLRIHFEMKEMMQTIRDEIAELKNQKPKPKIRKCTSPLEKPSKRKKGKKEKRAGSKKKHKTKDLVIDNVIAILPVNIPKGSTFEYKRNFSVQDITIKRNNTRYVIEYWKTPNGEIIKGEIPVSLGGGHFGATLLSYIHYLNHQCHVTQPLIHELLCEFEIDISKGQINNILIQNNDLFHKEKNEILQAGLQVSNYIHVDDTGARHNGKNGYCTHIGNELFAWFQSTNSKSRINFLELLRAGRFDYVINQNAIDYMKDCGLKNAIVHKLKKSSTKEFVDVESWEKHLDDLGIDRPRHRQIATESALMGCLKHHAFPQSLVIVSDDAGQFNIFSHSLCWIHAERNINKIIPTCKKDRKDLKKARSAIWKFYKRLKKYKLKPTTEVKKELDKLFNKIFKDSAASYFITLRKAMGRLYDNKKELLLVLERPEIPLHNNLSESDIREYVKKRKISGSTRHDLGKKARDTFTSLKKTCRKQRVPFWVYLNDRISGKMNVPWLPDLILKNSYENKHNAA